MKKALSIAVLIFAAATPASAADNETIYLPGNAQVRTNNDGAIVMRGYDADNVIYRRLINPNAGTYHYRPRSQNRIHSNDVNTICGGIERDRKRERCVEDVMDEREKLIRKYND